MVKDLHWDVGLGRVRVRTVTAGLVHAAVVAVVVGVVVHQIARAARSTFAVRPSSPNGEPTVVTASSAVLFRIRRLGANP